MGAVLDSALIANVRPHRNKSSVGNDQSALAVLREHKGTIARG